VDYIQLSAALHPSEADVPPEAMLDPVANTLDLRKPFDKSRAKRVAAAMKSAKIGLSDIAYFDNMLHHEPDVRKKKMDFMLRVFDAAELLGADAVCGFVGRNQQHSMDQNLGDFEEHFVPLLKKAKERGLTFRVEQCPMPGWTTGDNFHNNIGYTPGHGSHSIAFAKSMGSETSFAFTTIPPRHPHGTRHAIPFPVSKR
jgi:sugar phosphate isomerase/epimerase